MGAVSSGCTGELQGRLIQRCEVACYKGITFHLLRVPSRFLGSAWVGIPEPGWNSGCLPSWISAGSLRDQRRAGLVGSMLGGWEMLKSNRLAKTRRDKRGGPLQTFLVSLYFKLARIPYGSRKERVQGSRDLQQASWREGPLPKVRAHPCPHRRRALPPVARRRAPPALCREIWEVAWAESSYTPGASPAVRKGTVPLLPGLRATETSTLASSRSRTSRWPVWQS